MTTMLVLGATTVPLDLLDRAGGIGSPLDPTTDRHTMPSRFRSAVRALLVVLIAAASLSMPAGAQEPAPLPEDPFERLAEIQRRQAEAAMKVDLLELDAAQVQARLAQVDQWVTAQQAVVSAAQEELVAATLAADRAARRERAKAEELDELEALMAEIAVAAYMRPPQMAALNVILTHDIHSAEKADVMLRAKAQRDETVAEQLEQAEKALRKLRVQADDQAARAADAADDAAGALAELQRAKLEQVGLAERIRADLATTAAEIEALGGAEFEAVVAAQRATEALLARISREAAVPLSIVRGFRVHSDIAAAIEALLAQAAADGIVLGGWGHRSTAQQVKLRLAHCGGEGVSESEAVYAKPAGSCSPPTAKPGSSMHELGLAIDFTHAGASISSHASPAYQWLAANAGRYGLRNLPSEPWHWSVNGS
jgi:hypothetical protein